MYTNYKKGDKISMGLFNRRNSTPTPTSIPQTTTQPISQSIPTLSLLDRNYAEESIRLGVAANRKYSEGSQSSIITGMAYERSAFELANEIGHAGVKREIKAALNRDMGLRDRQ
jgi:hypothetical protein